MSELDKHDERWAIKRLHDHASNVGGDPSYERLYGNEACEIAALLMAQRPSGPAPVEVEVIDPYVMDLVRKHGHEMTNSEIVQKFLPKERLSEPPKQAHSMSEYRRITAQGGDILPPVSSIAAPEYCQHREKPIGCGKCAFNAAQVSATGALDLWAAVSPDNKLISAPFDTEQQLKEWAAMSIDEKYRPYRAVRFVAADETASKA